MRPEHGGEIETHAWPLREQGWLDFSVNINPVAPSISDADWLRAKQVLDQYPPPGSDAIEASIALTLGVANAGQVLSTRGGTEAIRLALGLNRGRTVHIPVPAFSEYAHLCQQLEMPFVLHPVDPARWHQPEAWIDFPIPSGSVVLIGNPNNPVGCTLPASELAVRIADSAHQDIRWIVDEAFVHLCSPLFDASLAHALRNHSNACIAGSLTKTWAIPGLRLGYLLHPNVALLDKLRTVQDTWQHSSLTHYWCQTMLLPHHLQCLQSQCEKIAVLRHQLVTGIETTALLRAYSSEVNYVLFEWMASDRPLSTLIGFLKNHKIHVRGCNHIPGMSPGRFIRIAVRDAASNHRLIAALLRFQKLPNAGPNDCDEVPLPV